VADAGPSPRARLAELYARVDGFFARAAARLPGPGGLTCHTGCTDCCRRRFSVTALEAEIVAEGLAALPDETRAAVAARAAAPHEACPALEEDGRCAVYASRPVICRTHGLPIRFAVRHDEGAPPDPVGPRQGPRSLPLLDACPRNFQGRDLAALPPDVILDQATLSTILGALDAARADEVGGERGERVDLAALLGGR
jgi:uncharacterized protein